MSFKWKELFSTSGFDRHNDGYRLTTPLSDEQRTAILEQCIIGESAYGWQIQHQASFFATLKKGKRPNHILHLLLSCVTFGIWLPVWLIIGLSVGEKTKVIEIDKFGNAIYR